MPVFISFNEGYFHFMERKKKSNRERSLHRLVLALSLIAAGLVLAIALAVYSEVGRHRALSAAAAAHVDSSGSSALEAGPMPDATLLPTPTEEPIEYVEQAIDFPSLWEVNKDCYAYIEIPGTDISYPIMRSSTQDDNYYLETTFEGTPGLPGSIFTQQITKPDFTSCNSLIYGHDMMNGTFFGTLYKYKEPGYLEEHDTILIWTPEKRLEYRVVAEAVFGEENISYAYDIESDASTAKFWEDLHNGEPENVFVDDYTPKEGDRLITLSTCIGPRPANRRLIVAVLEKENPVK